MTHDRRMGITVQTCSGGRSPRGDPRSHGCCGPSHRAVADGGTSLTLNLNPASLTPAARWRCATSPMVGDFSTKRETAMRVLRSLGVFARWCAKTVLRVAGLIAHRDQGVDPNGADYLYKPRPPEYRP